MAGTPGFDYPDSTSWEDESTGPAPAPTSGGSDYPDSTPFGALYVVPIVVFAALFLCFCLTVGKLTFQRFQNRSRRFASEEQHQRRAASRIYELGGEMRISLSVVWQRMKAAFRGGRISRVRAIHVRDFINNMLRVLFTQVALPGEIGVKRVVETIRVIVSSMLGLIPLASNAQSVWFVFLSVPILVYGIFALTGGTISNQIWYCFKSLLCPVLIRLYGFKSSYQSGSPFTWCNEFRKQRVVNPKYFLINQEYANAILTEEKCFHVKGPVKAPNTPPKDDIICQGWPEGHPDKRHLYKLSIQHENIDQSNCYRNVRLSFSEKDDLLDDRFYNSIETQSLQLIEKIFSYYSDPAFGGYVEIIRPTCKSYLAHSPRFQDICDAIISKNKIVLVAERRLEFNLIVGESFLSTKN